MTMCKCIRAGASKFLGLRRIFAQISPNLPKKLLCTFCLQIFSNTDHEDFLLCDFQKKEVFNLFFCKRRAPCFEVKQCWAPVLPRCSGICIDIQGYCPDFQRFCPNVQGFCPNLTNPNFCGCACIPCTPPSLCKWEETDKNTEHRIIETASFHLQSHDNFEGFFHSQQDTELHSNKGGSTQ